jgi:UDPglucose 6-dehydrogenase
MHKIAVVGIGKMGLCFALNLERSGYEILGVDIAQKYVQQIADKSLQPNEPNVEAMIRTMKRFKAVSQIEKLVDFQPELIFVMVATPDAEDRGYDHSQLEAVILSLSSLPFRGPRVDIVIGCTTLPGYCDSMKSIINNEKYRISYSPQFIAQGSIMRNLQYPDQVLIGENDTIAGDKIEEVYKKACLNKPEIHRMSVLSAEITKLATNCFLTMKIAFANAIGDLSSVVGAETDKILSAVGSDSRIGKKFMAYGFGYGGPCLPRDNRALGFTAKKNGIDLFLSRASDDANQQHLEFQFHNYMEKYSKNESIHFYSITYKKEAVLLDESQQLALAIKLAKAGRRVIIHEREEVINKLVQQFGSLFEFEAQI